MVATRVSVDDINLGARASHPPPEKRARSSSPVKQRRPTQDWSSLARSADGSLDRLFSTTSLSHDQLMLFSNSDISERLHISKADYAIPIPFQIQFPPRLTRKSSTSLLSSDSPILSPPQKLIFTGHSYEPVSPSIPSSPTFGHISPVSRPLSPVKPPPVTASRKKVSEFVKQTSSETSDQLSMIEEKSNAGNSRASSYKSKDLPSIPNGIPELSLTESRDEKDSTPDTPKTRTSEKIETQITPDVKRSPMTNTFTVKHKKSPILKNHAPGESERLTAAVQPSTKLNKSVHVYNMDIPELPSPRTPNKNPRTSKVSANSSNFPSSLPSEVPSSSTAIRHDTFVNTPNLKTDKRAFSEESRVSSVSSFSSFGDILNFTHTYMSSPNAKGEVRVSKHVADYMLDNDSSNNNHSTQAGIPPTKLTSISDKELKPTDVSPDKTLEPCDISDSCLKLNNTICDEGTTDHLPRSPKENSKQNSGIQPTKSLDTKPQDLSYSETEPLVISRRGSEKSTEEGKLDDNIGAGIGFHFPNNKSNATNSSDAKKKSRAQRPRARDSARSSMFSEGKIEIPDLDDESFWQTPMASPSVTISAPIPSTKRNLNTAARERSFDSDSDSSFNSQFTKLQSKTGSKNLPASKSSTTISSASSPIRHSRHRSMYNIDFDYKSVASPTHKQHNRSKSNACVGSSVNSFSGLDFLKKPQHVRNSSFHGQSSPRRPISKKPPIREDFENLDIRVNEPPKRVSYAVDFKFGDSPSGPTPDFHIQAPSPDYYHSYKSSSKPSSNVSYTGASDTSTTPSSKTGRATESTAPTENDNIVIDLTEEKYDICMISRNESTTSYKSTIEKTKDGKNVEVVLVEEDEECDDRDDLSSIYSRYMTNWEDRNRSRHQHDPIVAPNMGLVRKPSTYSETSEASDGSGLSWAASSESNFQVKSLASIRRQQGYKSKSGVLNGKAPAGALKPKSHLNKNLVGPRQDGYYDYEMNDSYDFKSFMGQNVQQ